MASNYSELVNEWLYIDKTVSMLTGIGASPLLGATCAAVYLGNKPPAPPPTPREIYTQLEHLPTATARIVSHTRRRADFDASEQDSDVLGATFPRYLQELKNTPFFLLRNCETYRQTFNSNDQSILIRNISDLLSSVTNMPTQRITETVDAMAKAVFSERQSNSHQNIYTNNVIDMTNLFNPTFQLVYISLWMSRTQTGGASPRVVVQQTYEVIVADFLVLHHVIAMNADYLVSLDQEDVNSWLPPLTSPVNQSLKLCFES